VDKPTAALRGNRRQDILDAAAKHFKEKGYAATSMRDIAENASVKTASLYYHFPSKAELLLAVYDESAVQLSGSVQHTIQGVDDPWERLRIACVTHLRNVLHGSDYVQVVMADIPVGVEPDLRARLAMQRDVYEGVFREIIAQLPIRSDVSRKYLLFSLLGAMAWVRVWYRPGGDTPDEIANRMVAIFQHGCLDHPQAGGENQAE